MGPEGDAGRWPESAGQVREVCAGQVREVCAGQVREVRAVAFCARAEGRR
jgi:hypothetical protein